MMRCILLKQAQAARMEACAATPGPGNLSMGLGLLTTPLEELCITLMCGKMQYKYIFIEWVSQQYLAIVFEDGNGARL